MWTCLSSFKSDYIYYLALCFRIVSFGGHVTHINLDDEMTRWRDDKMTRWQWDDLVLFLNNNNNNNNKLPFIWVRRALISNINLLQYPHVLGQPSSKKFFICSLLSMSTSSQSILYLSQARVSTHSFTRNKKKGSFFFLSSGYLFPEAVAISLI